MDINLKTKRTEYEWQLTIDAFFRQFTPQWFHWLHWAFLIGGVEILARSTGSVLLRVISIVSYLAMFYYFMAHIADIKISGLPFIKNDKSRFLASLILSGFLILLASFSISTVARAVTLTGGHH